MDSVYKWLLDSFITQVKFDYLLPKYKTEVVIDTILSIFIEELMNYCFKSDENNSDTIRLVSREFPIKKEENRQSVTLIFS